ncbi:hypothetical protein BGE01nite_44340 [Brevifollis gellanilyticus]|uniref:Uncharacterized protein n=2 Tax=Brevifollis gellanilyticus TaxID=748831 RepID=A0A512MEH8_9BACT|nr:hypothetical protein BGE01nite_44340 [Brevifollis gellanilyticus]
MWSALPVYFIVWLVLLSPSLPFLNLTASGLPLYPALAIACLYVAMHVYEISVRGHCYLCADSTAVPVTLLAVLLGGTVAHYTHGFTWAALFLLMMRGAMILLIAHIAAMIWAGLLTSIMRFHLRQRIATERAELQSQSHDWTRIRKP